MSDRTDKTEGAGKDTRPKDDSRRNFDISKKEGPGPSGGGGGDVRGSGDSGPSQGDKGQGDKGQGDKGQGDKGQGDKGQGDKGEKGDKGADKGADKGSKNPEYDVTKKDASSKSPDKGESKAKPGEKGDTKTPDKAPQKGQETKGSEKGDGKKAEAKAEKPATKDAPKNPRELDQKAKDIIKNVKDAKTPQEKAEKAIREILKEYYPGAKVKDVVYSEKTNRGLETERGNTDGKIRVSKDFVDNIDKHFARKVISVGHELQHVQQYKDGMNDTKDKNRAPEREFQANRDSAHAPEKPGTGVMDHQMRAAYADEALRNYDKMPPDDQTKYKGDADALKAFAASEREKSGGLKQ
jgi:hypothetical protein